MVEYSYGGSDGVVRSAVISECGLYRYRLDRVWDTGKAQVLFLMLNPSTAVPRQLYLPVGVNQFCRFTSLAWPRCWAALVR